jgi:hypothetical protein
LFLGGRYTSFFGGRVFLRKGAGYAKVRHPKFITLTIEITSSQPCSQGMLGGRYILVIKQKSTEGKEIEV